MRARSFPSMILTLFSRYHASKLLGRTHRHTTRKHNASITPTGDEEAGGIIKYFQARVIVQAEIHGTKLNFY